MSPQRTKARRQNKGHIKSHPIRLHPRKTATKCSATTPPKVKWHTKLDALMAMANTNNKQGSNGHRTLDSKKEIRVYRCPQCEYWHTTSQPWRPPRPKEDTDG